MSKMNRKTFRFLLCGVLLVVFGLASGDTADAQTTFFSRLDKNGNGYLDLDEIDDRSRAAIQRYADAGGLSITRPNSIRKWEYAYQKYRDSRNKSKYIEIEPASEGVRGFGLDETQPLVPDFNAAKIEYPYNQADIDTSKSLLRRYDKNKDGYMDREEADGPRWSGTSPFDFDYNNDDKISLVEFAQRYAHRRLTASRSTSTKYYDPTMPSTAGGYGINERAGSDRSASVNSDRNSQYLAASVFGRYDTNRDGRLTMMEARRSGVEIASVDQNRDGVIDRKELDQWLYQEIKAVASSDSDVLPSWFIERDLNGDSQVEMAEFTDEWDEETAERFTSFDANNDGIITADEAMVADAAGEGEYGNWVAQVMMPKRTLISEIEIEEDLIIQDLNVQLSITYTYDEHLDGYLAGPDGQRIELFTGVGRNDDHFDRTIFDDEASRSILKGRPPFTGSYQPEALLKRQPGLGYFKGKSTKGVWQLIIQTARCDRSGVFHGWALQAETEKRSESEVDSEDEDAGGDGDEPDGAAVVDAADEIAYEARDKIRYRSEEKELKVKARKLKADVPLPGIGE